MHGCCGACGAPAASANAPLSQPPHRGEFSHQDERDECLASPRIEQRSALAMPPPSNSASGGDAGELPLRDLQLPPQVNDMVKDELRRWLAGIEQAVTQLVQQRLERSVGDLISLSLETKLPALEAEQRLRSEQLVGDLSARVDGLAAMCDALATSANRLAARCDVVEVKVALVGVGPPPRPPKTSAPALNGSKEHTQMSPDRPVGVPGGTTCSIRRANGVEPHFGEQALVAVEDAALAQQVARLDQRIASLERGETPLAGKAPSVLPSLFDDRPPTQASKFGDGSALKPIVFDM